MYVETVVFGVERNEIIEASGLFLLDLLNYNFKFAVLRVECHVVICPVLDAVHVNGVNHLEQIDFDFLGGRHLLTEQTGDQVQ